MIPLLTAIAGILGALVAQDLAAQALSDQPLRPFAGTCPRCGGRRGWTTWKCPGCGRALGSEVGLIAAGGAVGWGLGRVLGPSPVLIAYLVFLVLTLALVETDLRDLRIVDRLNLRGTVAAVAALGITGLLAGSGEQVLRGLGGGLVYFAGANAVFLLARGAGFGYGDVKLSFQLGVFTAYWSWGTLGWAVLLTALGGGVVSLVVLTLGLLGPAEGAGPGGRLRAAMRRELPYGPVMVAGAWVAVLLAGLGALPPPT